MTGDDHPQGCWEQMPSGVYFRKMDDLDARGVIRSGMFIRLEQGSVKYVETEREISCLDRKNHPLTVYMFNDDVLYKMFEYGNKNYRICPELPAARDLEDDGRPHLTLPFYRRAEDLCREVPDAGDSIELCFMQLIEGTARF